MKRGNLNCSPDRIPKVKSICAAEGGLPQRILMNQLIDQRYAKLSKKQRKPEPLELEPSV